MAKADLILCEDTRVTRKLLSHHKILAKPLYRIKEFNPKSLESLLKLIEGKTAALVCDSGTPALSDPGAKLVGLAQGRITPIPGPSSVTAALSVSGLGRDGFVFLGFLAKSKAKKERELKKALELRRAVVFFESPYRILKTLHLLEEIAPLARCVLGRELTKIYEEILRGTPEEIRQKLANRQKILGEITVVVESSKKTQNGI